MKLLVPIFAFFLIYSCTPKNASQYSKIEYEAGACYGFCPIFKLHINPDRSAVIEAERFTFTDGKSKNDFSNPKEGTFKATITEADYAKLIKLLDASKLKSLKDDYGNNNVTDLPTSTLNITFVDGTSKSISDYGKKGTPELRELYTFLENLPKTQTWTKVAE